ncbi:MAG: cytochrome d ubiquinol oxidase subunit II [Ktedonobacteraceae bacterium]|nr:cytochrome d ubiquinol oxidase subunit II [Ktedonobacteraceae bacterium]MBO0790451.1 cytochrome d ubiquinol oxidase subunit II [Ktedonobacteraceae bacterium]
MQTLWFILVAAMLTMYVVLDGFDLGVGAIHPFVAKNDAERRMALRSIGPVWDGNEVWIIAAGGTLFFAFPTLYATSFSGFYLPLVIVLWLLMLRGVAIELRSRFPSQVWADFWDGTFFVGSSLLAFFFGVAMANVLRGVPLEKGVFFVPLWTDFNPFSAHPGVLDWYTVLIGLLAFTTLTAHGAAYMAVKTPDPLCSRARNVSRAFWIITLALLIPSTITTWLVQQHISANYFGHPWGFIFPVVALIGLVAMGLFFFNPTRSSRNDLSIFFSSCTYIVGILGSAAFGLYPLVLPAVNPANSLTVQDASASSYGQTVGLVWWLIGMVLAIFYFVFTYRTFWGKVSLTSPEGH